MLKLPIHRREVVKRISEKTEEMLPSGLISKWNDNKLHSLLRPVNRSPASRPYFQKSRGMGRAPSDSLVGSVRAFGFFNSKEDKEKNGILTLEGWKGLGTGGGGRGGSSRAEGMRGMGSEEREFLKGGRGRVSIYLLWVPIFSSLQVSITMEFCFGYFPCLKNREKFF